MPTTILIVDDHALFRKGLRLLLEEEPDMSVVGEAGDGGEAIERARELSPDVVVMDISMPGLTGIEATQQILSDSPETKVVALSIHAGKRFVGEMLSAGAAGYILKDSVPEEMTNGIRKVMGNEVYLSSVITGVVVSEFLAGGIENRYSEAPDKSAAILSTKLHWPPVDSNHVRRPHLLKRLDQGRRRPLTLVSAPAGYGKTSLVSSWLEASKHPSAWVSLDEDDSDLRLFLGYLLAAIHTLFPDACRKTLAMANSLTLPPASTLAGSLINELGLIEQPFTLALDDFHLIKDGAVLDLLTQLLHHPPQAMHLVLISRRDPPLPIPILRARSLLTDIRTQDLRFNEIETATVLTRWLKTPADAATVAVLEEKTEGWVAGLRLAVLSMRHRGHVDPKLLETQVDAQYVLEYLFDEVFSRQPPEIIPYILGTAILKRFCGPLCETVCVLGDDSLTCDLGGGNFIDWLKNENLFLIPLDHENRWFRYHHLFQGLLVKQLKRHRSSADIKDLHGRASTWFAENGLVEEALQHALAAGDAETAGRLVARHGYQLMNDEQWPHLIHWLGMLPRDRIKRDPELLMLEAWTRHARDDSPGVEARLERIEALCASTPPDRSAGLKDIAGHVDTLRGIQHYRSCDGKNALIRLRRACENIPLHHARVRLYAHINTLGSRQMVGDLAGGIPVYQEEMRDAVLRNANCLSTYLTAIGYVYWKDADLTNMQRVAESALNAAKQHPLPDRTPYALYLLGVVHYHRNELNMAEEKLAKVFELFQSTGPMDRLEGVFLALALTCQAQRKPAKARKISEALMAHFAETGNADLLVLARAFDAELAFRQGRLSEAFHWAGKYPTIPLDPTYRFYMSQSTLIKILLAQDAADSRQRAADLIDRSLVFFRSIHNRRFEMEVLALQALLHDSRSNEPAALATLAEALAIGESGGFIRLFVDLCPRMTDLLKRLIKKNVAMDYISRILAAFRKDASGALPLESDHPRSHTPSSITQPLVDPLTNRELDVLGLLAQRLTNKEIAAKLFISAETVKKHLSNIYEKLGVRGRRQSVERAKILGVI